MSSHVPNIIARLIEVVGRFGFSVLTGRNSAAMVVSVGSDSVGDDSVGGASAGAASAGGASAGGASVGGASVGGGGTGRTSAAVPNFGALNINIV